mgnify:FL=1
MTVLVAAGGPWRHERWDAGWGTLILAELEQNKQSELAQPGMQHSDMQGLVEQANEAANFLKTLGHDGRLTILCHLMTGPKSVTELEALLSARQAVVSQQLARLRLENLVRARRDGQAIFYSILDPKIAPAIRLLATLFDKNA